jgi:plasmid stabilization system protein ParE
MRRYRFTPSAAQALDRQIDYLISVNALGAARAMARRVHAYISETLCRFPFSGSHLPKRDVYESWIPGTRMVMWYTVSDTELVIVMIWHTSQGRDIDDETET